MSYQQPEDRRPYDPRDQVGPGPYEQAFGASQPRPYFPQPAQPVVVNVVQNAGPAFVVRRPVNHWMHFWLTFFTAGLWAPVWILAARKHRQRAFYVR